ncbi:MAG: PASTA domain-containing protein [Bifidobacteriaceae bacterium]|nr:PASTA domain-containing protein [Bifidobacteriaceae bacterium]
MYCNHCGASVAPGQEVCANCGAPLQAQAPAPAQGQAGAGAAPAAQAARPRRRALRVVAAVVAAVLVAVGAAAAFLGTRGMLPWQSAPVPTLAQIANGQGAPADSLTADQVERELTARGFRTSRVGRYAGKVAGAFLGFSNVREGQVVRLSDTIGILESQGPGVPQGTVGARAADSERTLAGMNVPVTYRAVVTSVPGSSSGPAGTGNGSTDPSSGSSSGSAGTSAAQPGTVVATYPADGQPVTDAKAGITVAVATQSDTGIPVGYYGQDPDAVESDLESRGYSVTRKARFSTKANVGKVVASDPALGTTADAGSSVTLYYGVDSQAVATDRDKAFANASASSDPASAIFEDTTEAAGLYCKADGSDCITLSQTCDTYGYYCFLTSSQLDPNSNNGYPINLEPCYIAQGTCMGDLKATGAGTDKAASWYDSPLLFGDTGTFELVSSRQIAYGYCGTDGDWNYWKRETMSGGDSERVCVNGQVQDYSSLAADQDVDHADDPGYQMDDAWYVYVPVGGDIKAVEDMGYFDADAVKEAASQGEPDADTPYLIARDPSLYTDQQRHEYKHEVFPDLASVDMTTNVNPSIAFLGNRARYAVKPAPSDQSAYYLVEDPMDPNNLGAFPETSIDDQIGDSSVSDSKSSDQKQADQAAAERQTAFEAIAGTYDYQFPYYTFTSEFPSGVGGSDCGTTTLTFNSDGSYSESFTVSSQSCDHGANYTGTITDIQKVDDHTYDVTFSGPSDASVQSAISQGQKGQVWLTGRKVTEAPVCTAAQWNQMQAGQGNLTCNQVSDITDDSGLLEKTLLVPDVSDLSKDLTSSNYFQTYLKQ